MLGAVVRNVAIVVGVMVVAILVLRNFTTLIDAPRPEAAAKGNSGPVNQMIIDAGRGGHFHVSATVGARTIEFVVDTGASMIALSRDDAEYLGYDVDALDFSGVARTANGPARYAPIILDEVTVGDIVVRDVDAAVMKGRMGKSLLGMSFLRRLAGFEVRDDRMILRW